MPTKNLRVGFRNLWKNKFYTILNIAGLTLSLAGSNFILIWVGYELGFDKFHPRQAHIYRVLAHLGNDRQVLTTIQAPLAVYGKNSIPGIDNAVRTLDNYSYSTLTTGNKTLSMFGTPNAYVDSGFFQVFGFQLLEGDKGHPFVNAHSVILSQSMARKLFGSRDAFGKELVVDNQLSFVVSGVMEDMPGNSSLRYDLLFPFSILAGNFDTSGPIKSIDADWQNYNYTTFLSLKDKISPATVGDQLSLLIPGNDQGSQATHYSLQPLSSMHLYNPDGTDNGIETVRIFFFVALFLLLIAAVNYFNISTARAMLRSKEMGIRKIIGADRIHLFCQFVLETGLLVFLSCLLALLLLYFGMPVFNRLIGGSLTFSWASPVFWLVFVLTGLSVLVLSSLYPALLVSSVKPLQILKGKIAAGLDKRSLRHVLVVIQFTLSIGLITATLVMERQLHYIQRRQLGYSMENIFAFSLEDNMIPHFAAIRNELLSHPEITGVTTSDVNIIDVGNSTNATDWPGKNPKTDFIIHPIRIDSNFISLFHIKIGEGHAFSQAHPGDEPDYILNETAVKETGIKDPVGKTFTLWGRSGRITGVVRDFNLTTLRRKIEPVILLDHPVNWRVYIKTTGRGAPEAIAETKTIYKRYRPGFPFQYDFLDKQYDDMYKSDQRTGKLMNIFAGIAIFISCIGLFGLAVYTAEVRTREIGIRKTLGAGTISIILQLAKGFLLLVLLSIVVALPISYYYMHSWLSNFAYRVPIDLYSIFAGGIIGLLIATLSISVTCIKAARANPVRSLRTDIG